MTLEDTSGVLERLRREFDHSFSRPRSGEVRKTEWVVVLGLGGGRVAVRIDQLGAIHSGRKVVQVPSENAALVGLAGVRGRVVPVFDLASLLGLGRSPPQWRWLAVASLSVPAGFSFERLELQAEIELGTELVTLPDGVIPVVDLRAVLSPVAERE